MKKVSVLLIIIAAMVFQYCSSSKKLKASKASRLTYEKNIQPLVMASCSPCHFPPRGNKKPLDNYVAVKSNIDDILTRIQKNPGDRGFMPAMHPKLSDSTINLFMQWKNNGFMER